MNTKKTTESKEKPHYLKHRKRLKNKFDRTPEGLDDAEIIELLLGYVIRSRDVKPQSKGILTVSKHIGNIFESDFKNVKGVGDESVRLFKIIRELNTRSEFRKIINAEILSNPNTTYNFLWNRIAHERVETYLILFLNSANKLKSYKFMRKGTVNQVSIYAREIIEEAIKEDSVGVVIAHNHPSGNATPSKSDLTLTQKLCHALQHTDITILDYIIVTYHEYYSMANEGYIANFS